MTINDPGVLDTIKEAEEKIHESTGIKVSLKLVDSFRDKFKDKETTARIVCEATGIPLEAVKHKTRKKEVIAARHLIMYYAAIYEVDTLKSIGKYLGGRDHSTVIHGREKIRDMVDTNDYETIENITKINKLILE